MESRGHSNKNSKRDLFAVSGTGRGPCLMSRIQEYARDINYIHVKKPGGSGQDRIVPCSRCFAWRADFLAGIPKYSSF